MVGVTGLRVSGLSHRRQVRRREGGTEGGLGVYAGCRERLVPFVWVAFQYVRLRSVSVGLLRCGTSHEKMVQMKNVKEVRGFKVMYHLWH